MNTAAQNAAANLKNWFLPTTARLACSAVQPKPKNLCRAVRTVPVTATAAITPAGLLMAAGAAVALAALAATAQVAGTNVAQLMSRNCFVQL